MDDAGAAVADTGLTRVYKLNGEPIVDLIFVHGLQGHPRETWTCTKLPSHESSNISKSLTPSVRRREERIVASDDTPRLSHSIVKPGPLNIFWPRDLLPEDCPNAQIWTWGYDTKVTTGYGASNHNSLFAHARDLLFALKRRQDVGRPLVFVAHSLSRIIVKEVLRRSKKAEDDEDHELYDIIVSTKAVVFLGTPYRGSPGFPGCPGFLVFAKRILDLSRGLIEVQNMVFKRLLKRSVSRVNEHPIKRRNAIASLIQFAGDRFSWSQSVLSNLSLSSIGSKWRQRISVASFNLDASDRDDRESDDGAEPAGPDFARDGPNGLEGTRVQFIHESVRDFFLSTGVRLISKSSQQAALGYGHLVLGRTCLYYLSVSELADIRGKLDIYRFFNSRALNGHPRTWDLPGFALLPYVALFCVEHSRLADRAGFAPNFFLERASLILTFNVPRNLVSLETGGQRPFSGFDNVILFLCRKQFLETVRLCVRDERFAIQTMVKNFDQQDALDVLITYATNPTDKVVTALENEITKAKAAET